MNTGVLLLVAKQFYKTIFKSRAIYLLLGLMAVLLFYTSVSGVKLQNQNQYRIDHQKEARKSWESNPDKHPHRMAHFGTFAFRLKHPLSSFDFGLENYTGNAVFLEAHRQNVVNFSEASFSTSLLRFGELSMAMVLQSILPLILFFIGYSSIVAERENGTLKILLTQGANWREILFGKSLGLFGIGLTFLIPYLLTIFIILILKQSLSTDNIIRFSFICSIYTLFVFTVSILTILISSKSNSSKNALISLLGVWLFFVILIPRSSQALGSYFFKIPSKIEFRADIEEEAIQYGDSHDPNDPHFNHLKDSILTVHNVTDVSELPFNYGGFLMKEGERITSMIYKRHQAQLQNQYRKQNQLTKWLALINPYLAVKNTSMSLSGSDFESYTNFQNQAEDYRYQLAQTMNELQMKYISPKRVSGSEGKVHVVKQEEWKAIPDFQHQQLTTATAINNELISFLSILIWFAVSIWLVFIFSKTAKAI